MTDDPRLSRRDFLTLSAFGALGAAGGLPGSRSLRMQTQSSGQEALLHVGTYTGGSSRGIYTLWMNRETGALRPGGLAAATAMPSYLALHPGGRFLYAVNELDEFEKQATGAVSSFAVDRSTGRLTFLGRLASGGAAPCYIVLDRAARVALVANYNGGSVAAFPVRSDGRLGQPLSTVKHAGRGPNAERQEAPHAHFISPDPTNRWALANDLGIDRVLVYRMDERTGALAASPAAEARMKAGAGPRHLSFHPDGRRAFVLNELDSTLVALAWDAERGALTETQALSSRAEGARGENLPADVHVAASGRVVYASNRGDDTIAVFAIDEYGRLSLAQTVPTGGKWPRNFALDPSGRFLLVANQRSDSITVFSVDAATGRITPTAHRAEVPEPACLRFHA